MVTLEQARDEISRCYEELRSKCFRDCDQAAVAKLQVVEGDFASGYSHSENQITIYLCDGDLAIWDLPRFGMPPPWRVTLLHEIVHEYQSKVVTDPSEEGVSLMTRHPNYFDGRGHDERFYTAIVEIAPAFELSADQFLESI
jgi:hypothetical protein